MGGKTAHSDWVLTEDIHGGRIVSGWGIFGGGTYGSWLGLHDDYLAWQGTQSANE